MITVKANQEEAKKKSNIGRLQRMVWDFFKKIPGLFTSTARKKVTFITIHLNEFELSNLYAALAISLKTYYKYRNKQDSDYYEYLLIKEVF